MELAAKCGLDLDDWQQYGLDSHLSEAPDGRWAAFECGTIVGRQNGKNSCIEARELAGLFVFEERLIVHTAHEHKTALEAFLRIVSLMEGLGPQDRAKIKTVRTSHGEEGIELRSGARLRFLARSASSGRGFTGDVVIFDEAFHLPPETMAALLPTMSARPNAQIWYAAMAGLASSAHLRAVRERAQLRAPRLSWMEWSAEDEADLDDRAVWLQANPSMTSGRPNRITEEAIERERAVLGDEEFARERLCIWGAGKRTAVISAEKWGALADRLSQAENPLAFAVDVPPDGGSAAIGVAGYRTDGQVHVEVVDHRDGTGWVVGRLGELKEKWGLPGVMLDPASAAGALIKPIVKAGLDVVTVSGREMAQACGGFFNDVQNAKLVHLAQPMLNVAVDAARKRTVGDAWAWHRRDTTSDISPLVAVTLARHALEALEPEAPAPDNTVLVLR